MWGKNHAMVEPLAPETSRVQRQVFARGSRVGRILGREEGDLDSRLPEGNLRSKRSLLKNATSSPEDMLWVA